MSDAIERLKAAVMSPEDREDRWAKWLQLRADHPTEPFDVEDLTPAAKSELRMEFDNNVLAAVLPSDILEACKLAKEKTPVVLALKKGSLGARNEPPGADGKPKKVFIQAKDLEHLLGQVGKASKGKANKGDKADDTTEPLSVPPVPGS